MSSGPLRIQAAPPPSPRAALTARVRLLAARHGLTISGITSTLPFDGLTDTLTEHIEAGHVDGLDWFNAERARIAGDVRHLHPTAQSIVSVGLAYWPGPTDKPDDGVRRGRISRYAWGRDYHRILKRRMRGFVGALENELGARSKRGTWSTRRGCPTGRLRHGPGWAGSGSTRT